MSAPPLAVVTADDALADEVLRLALVAGARAGRARSLAEAAGARLAIVGPDAVPDGAARLPLVVVVRALDSGDARRALTARAEALRVLPEEEAELVEDLRRAGVPARRGELRVVVGCSGGVGASTVAAAVAAASPEPAVLVDADVGSRGLELALGLEEQPGLRWSALVGTSGDVAPEALRDALPRWGATGVLGNDGVDVPDDALERVLDAARAGGPVVLDLPRHRVLAGRLALPDASEVLAVIRGDLVGAVAGRRVCDALRERGVPVRPVVRAGGVPTAAVQDVVGATPVVVLRHDRSLAARTARGLPAPPSSRLVRTARAAAW